MQTIREPEPQHRLLHHKLKESFAPTYLTAISVIQGVVLADLASIVLAGYQQFTIIHWRRPIAYRLDGASSPLVSYCSQGQV